MMPSWLGCMYYTGETMDVRQCLLKQARNGLHARMYFDFDNMQKWLCVIHNQHEVLWSEYFSSAKLAKIKILQAMNHYAPCWYDEGEV